MSKQEAQNPQSVAAVKLHRSQYEGLEKLKKNSRVPTAERIREAIDLLLKRHGYTEHMRKNESPL